MTEPEPETDEDLAKEWDRAAWSPLRIAAGVRWWLWWNVVLVEQKRRGPEDPPAIGLWWLIRSRLRPFRARWG